MPRNEEMSRPRTVERYEELGLADALSRPYDYFSACQELALILRLAYAKLRKSTQSLIFLDTLSAFRLLEVRPINCISAANYLVLAAEVALPKHKKALASSEFKRSMVKLKRRDKVHQLEGSLHLPQDVILCIFRFLDVWSLVSASSVCWAWNAASKDNMLWMSQYSLLFGPELSFQTKLQFGEYFLDTDDSVMHRGGKDLPKNFDWRGAFIGKFIGNSAWKSRPHRAICRRCKSIFWLSKITCETPHRCPASEDKGIKIRPISPYMIVEYILGKENGNDNNSRRNFGLSSSDSDNSEDDGCHASHWQLPKLWALPRLKGN